MKRYPEHALTTRRLTDLPVLLPFRLPLATGAEWSARWFTPGTAALLLGALVASIIVAPAFAPSGGSYLPRCPRDARQVDTPAVLGTEG